MSYPGASGSGTADAAGWAFNPPPGWPVPPSGWQPPDGWQPDPSWPPAPDGWDFWVPARDAGAPATRLDPPPGGTPLMGTPYHGAPYQDAAYQATALAGAGAGGGANGAANGATEVRLTVGELAFTVRPGQEARIGRAPDNDIVVNDPTVSRQHAVVRPAAAGWEYAQAGSAPTFSAGQTVSQVTVDRPMDLALGSPDGPVLHLEPVATAAAGHQGGSPAPDPNWRLSGAAAGAPGSGPVGYPPPQQQRGGQQPGFPPQPGWNGPGQPAPGNDDMASMLRILFPIQSWRHNSGWRQGLRLGVIIYALLPLIFLTVLSSSSSLSTPGWAYSLYVAPLWLGGFWLLIRPPDAVNGQHVARQEIIIAVAIAAWTLVWINVVTININDALPTSHGIGLLSAIVIGINEEVTKALPVFLAGIIMLRYRHVKLDVRWWMLLGTVAGLTFGVAEQAFYTSSDIVAINVARSPSEAVTAILAFAERVFVDGFQHAVWAGISGFFMGLAVNYHRRRWQLVGIGIGTPALLHALNDWLAGSSPWFVIIIQAASLLLFLGYTMTASAIEQKVRETPLFRGESIIMEAFRLPGQGPGQGPSR
ncbi:MAG TPA: PrsW family glutamic-type intramembrane protease [Trebonia sp.]|jgi:RsiW-degrading membrane proteinase PrsW (M82 family)|nr:PrsW family glutamic-type intramembrane protease [Trebonia sp.]